MPQSRSDRDPSEQQSSRPPAQTPGPAAPPPPLEEPRPAAEIGRTPPGTDALPGYDGTSTPAAGIEEPKRQVTRAGMIWAAVASALVVLVLLIVFILQNQELVQVKFFGLEGAVALGIALFIAAVGGGVLVAMAGAARIIQLRAAEHRRRVSATRRR
ncbi:lipopolysaccharide assembly LapA domain-containing protein [Arthrobacter sp. NPDC093139]|uniref:LapA family protein n=1 Tax=Arthrobacter sp. NPDC093139 TaxID=3363945 RepID=UPI0038250949